MIIRGNTTKKLIATCIATIGCICMAQYLTDWFVIAMAFIWYCVMDSIWQCDKLKKQVTELNNLINKMTTHIVKPEWLTEELKRINNE